MESDSKETWKRNQPNAYTRKTEEKNWEKRDKKNKQQEQKLNCNYITIEMRKTNQRTRVKVKLQYK